MDELTYKLREGFTKMGGSVLTDRQIEMFREYIEILLHWNSFMNLTRITDIDEIISEHFLDSLSIIGLPATEEASRIMDIGTGPGFPGIPLKIYYPEKDMVLLDSQKKKVDFLDAVVDKLNLEGIETIHGRAEDIARERGYREGFDLVVSRAVASLPVLLEYAMPFVRVGGTFIAYKGPNVYDEIKEAQNAMDLLGAEICDVKEVAVPYSDKTHILLIIDKITKIDNMYPRRAGKPKKTPL